MADAATTEDGAEVRADLARALADEVRDVIVALSTLDADEQDLREALALAQQLKGHLHGPRRTRWYEVEDLAALDVPAKESFHELSPFRGRINALAPPLDLVHAVRDDGTPVIRATVTMGEAYEGPPHGVHGGFVAALFDEVLGATQSLTQRPGVTGRLTVHYRHLTPLAEPLAFEAWIEREEGRRMVSKATCHAADGTLCADADGLFFTVDFEALQQMMQERKQA
jgi:acyl-coenzyme A thioesterase PaaI-like protein